MVSLTVETALGSFDFLNTSDWEEEEEEKGDRNRNGRSVMLNGLLVNALKPKHRTNVTLHIDLKRWDFSKPLKGGSSCHQSAKSMKLY